ncbi:MAG: serine/threonine-protein kinase [bacterium]
MTLETTIRGLDASTAPLAAGRLDPHLGRVLGGKYTLTALIGEGGFGAVYRATQAPLGRLVAVKLLHRARHDPAELRRRFALEARALARLSAHAGCVALVDVGEEPDGLLYLVQAFVDGRPLDALLRERGPLSPARAVAIAAGVLDALDAAHHAGIVHRDVKPANVMLTVDHRGREQVKLLDFGIARLVGAAREGIGPSDADVIVGSVHYMAPEQFSGEGIGPATDLYAVGMLLYTLLTGAPPFTGSAVAVMHDHLTRAAPPLGDAPAGLQRVIERALAKAPADRFADAVEMRTALLGALEAVPRPRRWRPGVAVAGLVAGAALAVVVLGRAPVEPGLAAGTVASSGAVPAAVASPGAAAAAAVASPAAAAPAAVASPAAATPAAVTSPVAAAPAAEASPTAATSAAVAPPPGATSTAVASPGAGTPAAAAASTPLVPKAPRPAASTMTHATPAAQPAAEPPVAVVTATPTPDPHADALRVLRKRIRDAIDRCDCAAAGRQFAALALDPEDSLRRRYHERCRRLGHACLKPR